MVLTPVVAGLATVAASTSLTGVIGGARWLGYVLVVVLLIVSTGFGLRSLRVPPILVAFGQLLVLLFVLIAVFTRSGVAGFLPGPTALEELGMVLGSAAEEIRTGLPPVEPNAPILCLVTIALGLVAVLVDTLAVAALAPAATGLVLLCVYAVPASLASEMLPWWTFLLGAACFALLLAVDGNHRHQRWSVRSSGPGAVVATRGHAGVGAAVIACIAIVFGLGAGSQLTAIGTEGRLPGAGGGDGGGTGGLGVKPFTALRGLLDQNGNTELFRIRGLGNDNRYLRTLTLNHFRPGAGWEIKNQTMSSGSPATGQLPVGPGVSDEGQTRTIRIEPTNWMDVWLPVYGQPRGLEDVSDDWRYDVTSGTVFTEKAKRADAYTQTALLSEPTARQLRASNTNPSLVDPVYTEAIGVDQRVSGLARRLTERAPTSFDKVASVWRYFSPGNGFTYDTQTAPATDPDALADFVLRGKRGFCEQYASAMAVMLRSIGIPSRVAIGFTSGYTTADYRSISSQDAHAWVEVFFEGHGWVTFDPTPLSDGRGYVPDYLRGNQGTPPDQQPTPSQQPTTSSQSPPPSDAAAAPPPGSGQDGGQRPDGTPSPWLIGALAGVGLLVLGLTVAAVLLRRRPGWAAAASQHSGPLARLLRSLPALIAAGWTLLLVLTVALVSWWLAVLTLALCVLVAPALARELARRRRMHAVAGRGADAADAAWRELLAECTDRGESIPDSETVRTAARKLAARHNLDDEGKENLRALVSALERSWYAADQSSGPELPPAFDGVRQALRRRAPLALRARLLPRSILPGWLGRT
ncbi:MAG: transglutaminase [Pseudonocardiaceae bacterium]|nr:transglutaminase [Pseudonocardiaceae bacterium]